MRKFRKLAAVFAVFLIALCFCSTVAYAAPEDATQPAESDTTQPPANNTAETTTPEDSDIETVLPPGTGTVVDVFAGEDGRKFYTIQTPAGNTFYLIIDFTQQAENVYFLDAVQEKDLLALAETSATPNSGGDVSAAPGTNINSQISNDVTSEPSNDQTEPKPEATTGNNMFSMILVIAVVVIGGGAGIYFKVIRKKRNTDSRDEYEADEDEYIPDEPEADGEDSSAEPEDDLPPWEDEENV